MRLVLSAIAAAVVVSGIAVLIAIAMYAPPWGAALCLWAILTTYMYVRSDEWYGR